MTNGTARLSLREALEAAEGELSLSEESGETDISSPSVEEVPEQEQLAVETSEESGLFDSLLDDDEAEEEQPHEEDSYEVTVDGERVLVTLSELRSGYMRQADYTQKTQAIADRERQAEKALALMAALEERPTATLRALYNRINAGKDLDFRAGDTNPSSEPATQTPDLEDLVEQRVQAALASDPRMVQLQQERALAQIEDIFAKIEEDYGVELQNNDKTLVLQRAQEQGTTDLEGVFGSLYAKKLKADRQRDLARRHAKDVAPIRGEGMQVEFNPQSAQPKKYDNFRAALDEQLALEQEG